MSVVDGYPSSLTELIIESDLIRLVDPVFLFTVLSEHTGRKENFDSELANHSLIYWEIRESEGVTTRVKGGLN